MSKLIISLSGGMDSATMLGLALSQRPKEDVAAVGFRYPSKHNDWECTAATELCQHYGMRLKTFGVSGLFLPLRSDLLASGGDLPEGHYEAESMRRTVVPGRNLIFLSALAALCESEGGGDVWIGAHAGDHHIYPDCRPAFLSAAREAVRLSSDGKVNVFAPFVSLDKAGILKLGLALGVPYRITRTCYADTRVACGRCGSCQERLWAFSQNGVEDPLEYASRQLLPKS